MNACERSVVGARRVGSGWAPAAVLAVVGALVPVWSAPLPGASVLGASVARAWAADEPKVGDTVEVLFKNGKTATGELMDRDAGRVKINVKIGGLSAPAWYQTSEILKITLKSAAGAGGSGDAGSDQSPVASGREPVVSDGSSRTSKVKQQVGEGANRVYVIELTGQFGKAISQTPLREAVRDAQNAGATLIILKMDNDWSQALVGGLKDADLGDDAASFDQLFRAEDMDPIFTEEVSRWPERPKVVFWIKNAMGGAAFLPLITPDIYFHSEGRMGGIGNLSKLFDQGDEVVKQKQYSLRMAHAEGMAITGGHDPRIVKAMARHEYVLWVRFEGGRPVLIERAGDAQPTDLLLTDDGEGDNEDNIQQLARGEGNDVLTLNAKLAYDLGISKGSADTLEDLLFELGVARDYALLDGRAPQIFETWREGVANAERNLVKLWRDYEQVQPGEGENGVQQARGQRLRIIDQMQRLLSRYKEAVIPQQLGVPTYDELSILRDRIKLEQLSDGGRR